MRECESEAPASAGQDNALGVRHRRILPALIVLVLVGILVWNISTRFQPSQKAEKFSEFMQKVDSGQISSATIVGNEITYTSKSGDSFRTYAPAQYEGLANKLIEHGRNLRAGDMILTGSVHPPAFLPGPGVARTEFEGLGGTEITIR